MNTIPRVGDGFSFDIRSSYWQSQNADLTQQLNLNYRKNGLDVFGTFSYRQNGWLQDSRLWQKTYVDTLWTQDKTLFSEGSSKTLSGITDGRYAARVANIADDIERLPLGYNTKIGQDGQGVSQGQRQRILIARAVYKNPQFSFLDEETNALDANNEKAIVENLSEFYKEKTVVVVTHRLSTVKNADQIVVLDGGRVVETGTHEELTAKRGAYYALVKNQLELGN